MYYRGLKFCIIYLALNKGCFEVVLMKNTPRTLRVNTITIEHYHYHYHFEHILVQNPFIHGVFMNIFNVMTHLVSNFILSIPLTIFILAMAFALGIDL
jgi:hypothetical protein